MVVIGFTVEASGDTFVMFVVADDVALVPSVSSNDSQIIDGADLATPVALVLKTDDRIRFLLLAASREQVIDLNKRNIINVTGH